MTKRKTMTGQELGKKLLQSVSEMKAGKKGRTTQVTVSPIADARNRSGLTQAQLAALLGVSLRTLQDWEQGRRVPSGAAQTLLRVAVSHPEVLRELAAA